MTVPALFRTFTGLVHAVLERVTALLRLTEVNVTVDATVILVEVTQLVAGYVTEQCSALPMVWCR